MESSSTLSLIYPVEVDLYLNNHDYSIINSLSLVLVYYHYHYEVHCVFVIDCIDPM